MNSCSILTESLKISHPLIEITRFVVEIDRYSLHVSLEAIIRGN